MRSSVLASDDRYRGTVAAARGEWNTAFPKYQVRVISGDPRTEPPQRLLEDVAREREVERRDLSNDRWVVRRYESFEVLDAWNAMIRRITMRYWPSIDFPHPAHPEHHPVHPFVVASLYADPRTLSDKLDQLVYPLSLAPEPMLTSRDVNEFDGVESTDWDKVAWCIPVYPGLTAKDLELSAPAIAEYINQLFADRTPQARIRALRCEGRTQEEIAEQLGIQVSSVRSTLKSKGS